MTMRFPSIIDECSTVTKLEELVTPPRDEEGEEYLALLKGNSNGFTSKVQFESLELSSYEYKQSKPSIEEPSKLDLKVVKRHNEPAGLSGRGVNVLEVLCSNPSVSKGLFQYASLCAIFGGVHLVRLASRVFLLPNDTRCVPETQKNEFRQKPKNCTVDPTRACGRLCGWSCARHSRAIDVDMALHKTQSCGGSSVAVWATRACGLIQAFYTSVWVLGQAIRTGRFARLWAYYRVIHRLRWIGAAMTQR
ncbi:hypothetical protein EPI10_016037 [Gossypium australe]|uniref:Uncharacterized protein n=1 Tax=Gossypium australe TaxID=47621 RepID=A0A5B6VMI7_9ROSI|nr:hypothetical protein EPI10_016037 [Gossypium australe]